MNSLALSEQKVRKLFVPLIIRTMDYSYPM